MIDEQNLLEKLYTKQEKLAEDMSDVKVILASQEINLQNHMKRSDLLEQHLEVLRSEIKPVQKHVYYVNGIIKALGLLSIVATIVRVIFEILK